MFWKRKDSGQKDNAGQVKLAGPKDISEAVKKSLLSTGMIDPDIIPFLKSLSKPDENNPGKSTIRIFDPADAEARGVKIKDYLSLDEEPEMIIAEGQYDESSKAAKMEIKRSIPKYNLLTYDEILSQIEGLKEPGESVFFFMSAGTGAGGPLGRGAAVIKLNDPQADKKAKKYTIYGCNVINNQPTKDLLKIFDSDKAKEVAKWTAEGQKPRFC
jgi:hypothetical protein